MSFGNFPGGIISRVRFTSFVRHLHFANSILFVILLYSKNNVMELIEYLKQNALLVIVLLVVILAFSYFSLKRNRKKLDDIKKKSAFYNKDKKLKR